MQAYNFRTRILIPLTLALALLLGGFVISFYQNQKEHLHADVINKLESVNKLFTAQLDNDAQMMGAGLEAVLRDKQLMTAFRNKDRGALLKRSSPLFEKLRGSHRITHFYFTGPDRANILRVHKPDKYGDKIDRYTTLEAERSGKLSCGIELGPLGTFTLRVVAPWYEGDRLIGFVEFGEEIEHITQRLHDILQVELYVVIEKHFLNRKNWEAGMRMLGRKAAWDQFPTVVMIDQTTEAFSAGLIEFLDEQNRTSMETDVEVLLNDRRYRTRFMHLQDVSGRGVGDMVIMFDVTDIVANLRTAIFRVGAICLVVGGVLFLLFYILLGQIEHQIAKSSEALQDSEEKYRSMMAAMIDAAYICSPNFRVEYMNPAMIKQTGRDAVGEFCYKAINDFDKQCPWCVHDKIQQGESAETKIVSPKNNRFYDISHSPIFHEDGSVSKMTIYRDTTKSKQALKRTERLNHLNEDLLGSGSLDEKLRLITDKIVEIFKADFARIWLIKPGDLCDFECPHAKVTEGPHVCRHRERCLHLLASSGRYTHIDGGHRRVPFGCFKIGRVAAEDEPKFLTDDVTNDPRIHNHDWARKFGLVAFAGYRILSADGKIIGALALFSKQAISSEEDAQLESLAGTTAQVIQAAITKEEKKQLESQLQQSQKMESIGTLAGGIAHDFNNILFPIMGFSELALSDTPEDSPLRNNIKEILQGAKRARDLVKQILAFSRQSDQQPKPLKVQLIIKEVLKLIRSSLPSTIEIKQHISNQCGLVMADATQIHQVAMNLMTNAFQAMEDDGGKLEVTLKEVELGLDDLTDQSMSSGAYVCLTVANTGPGMDQSVISRVFEPYFTTKEDGKGTGLGLAVVYGIVKSYKGDIRVYSEPGEGTAFHVYLPVLKSKIETEEIDAITPVQKGTERILLVDDEEPIIRMEKQMLERLGYQVTACTSSPDALMAFRASPGKFDLVITDMTMPNMTGVQLSQKLLEIRPDIPIIICTGFSTKVDGEKAKAAGIRGYVMKPVVTSEIAKKIREVLDQD
ncbi:MAG: response regulator [Desulfobacteraceae bacterium]|nr:response regulator [Desulfobacteraceae bacterium]